MATPRLFVSSTCYDLQEIRFQLRNFIRDFGYDAVMSEFDDIFYSYDSHVQDSCVEEINKCQLFILVIGNNYGSFYHQDKQKYKTPDSVTLREFRRALEAKIYKHIFINKYVEYDYKNYKRALDKANLRYFQENDVSDDEIESARDWIKKDFDEKYHFAYDSYKYVFYFLDIVHDLKENNAISTFESFVDIKDNLRKQWAGFMYESLMKKDRLIDTIIQPLESKIDKIEKNILKLIESKTENKDNQMTFDLANLTREINIENLEELQNKIQSIIIEIRFYPYWIREGRRMGKRIFFSEKFSPEMAKNWLDSLKKLTQSFKWSKEIQCETVFDGFPLSRYDTNNDEIAYKALFELYGIYNSLGDEDKIGLINTICQEFNKSYEAPNLSVDDLPF